MSRHLYEDYYSFSHFGYKHTLKIKNIPSRMKKCGKNVNDSQSF